MGRSLMMMLLIVALMSCSQNQDSKEAAFWRWFRINETRLFEFEKDQERIFDELQLQLQRIHSSLTFEFGPKQEGKREFVISADGIKEAFLAVIGLADAAPPLPRWKITKFRPRRGFQSPVILNGLRLSPEQLQFTIEPDGAKAGITLFIEGYSANEHLKYASVVYLMLDQALGEYDVETKIGFIELKSNSGASNLAKQPFSALPPTFDKFVKSISKD